MTTEEYIKMQSDGMRNIYTAAHGQFIDCLFGIGDIVKLKSGGDSMTVSGPVDPSGNVTCTFVREGTRMDIHINQRCLKRVRWWTWIFDW